MNNSNYGVQFSTLENKYDHEINGVLWNNIFVNHLKAATDYIRTIQDGTIMVSLKLKKQINKINAIITERGSLDKNKPGRVILSDKAKIMSEIIESNASVDDSSGGKFVQLPYQAFITDIVFGLQENSVKTRIYKEGPKKGIEYHVKHKTPLFNYVFVLVARGSGKSTFMAAITMALFVANIAEGKYNISIALFAKNDDQVEIIYKKTRDQINMEGSIYNMFSNMKYGNRTTLVATENAIKYLPTNSMIGKYSGSKKSKDGLNFNYIFADEVHDYDNDSLKTYIDGTVTKRQGDFQVFMITTNGTKRHGYFDDKYKEFSDALDNLDDIHKVAFFYELDDIKEVNKGIENKKIYGKAMPALGFIATHEDIKQKVINTKNPKEKSELLAKYFNIPQELAYKYFKPEMITGNVDVYSPIVGIPDEKTGVPFVNRPAIIGLDYAEKADLAVFSLMSIIKGIKIFDNLAFFPASQLKNLTATDRERYERYQRNGELIIHDKEYNDPAFLFEELNKYMYKNAINPVGFAYDNWHSSAIVDLYKNKYGDSDTVYPVRQGPYTLSVPMKNFYSELADKTIAFNSEIATWNYSNVTALSDSNGNIKPYKDAKSKKIDIFAANLDAYTFYSQKEPYYNDIFRSADERVEIYNQSINQ